MGKSIEETIFERYRFREDKLRAYGFEDAGGELHYRLQLPESGFRMEVYFRAAENWFSVILDGKLEDREIMERLAESYESIL